jgi:predicted transposase/invertase (TIGR01784 family)
MKKWMDYNHERGDKMTKFYTCKYDRPFKEIMLNEKNKNILKALLERILQVTINNIQILNQEKNVGNIHIKRKHLDAILETSIGKIGIEVNSENKPYVHPKSMAYICNEYASYTLSGEEYTEDMMIMQINLSYGLGKSEKNRVYKIQDKEGKLFVKNFEIYEVNMDYYKKLWDNKDKKGIKEDNLLIMLDLEENELKELSKNNQMVKEYMEELVKLNENPKFQEYMSAEEDARKIRNSELSEAKRDGMKQSFKEMIMNMINYDVDIEDMVRFTNESKETILNMIKELSKKNPTVQQYLDNLTNGTPRYKEYMSVEEDARKIRNSELSEAKRDGMKQGMKQGEHNKQLDIAKKMLIKNVDIQDIIEFTGLSKEEINNLH